MEDKRRRIKKRCNRVAILRLAVGIEIHAQLACARKLFSAAPLLLDDAVTTPPNSTVSLFDAAFPGTLPRLNRDAVRRAVAAARALGCAVQRRSAFDRKHYTYPDLPAGYQITQHRLPLALDGALELDGGRRVRIMRVQLEQDTGKTLAAADGVRLVDLNRAGAALVEIVSAPDMRSAAEAAAFVARVQQRLRAAGASRARMQWGEMRADVNVSIFSDADEARGWLGTRVEVKNVSGVRAVRDAVGAEAARQRALVAAGAAVARETRGYDHRRRRTTPLRAKEQLADYRFMPEPDVPELRLSAAFIDAAVAAAAAAPAAAADAEDAADNDDDLLAGTERLPRDVRRWTADAVRAHAAPPALLVDCVVNGRVDRATLRAAGAAHVADALRLQAARRVSAVTARALIADAAATQRAPSQALAARPELAMRAVDDDDALLRDIFESDALRAARDAVRGGDDRKRKVFVGEYMRRTKGRGDARQAAETFDQLFEGDRKNGVGKD